MDVKGKISSSAQQRFSVLQAFFCLFVFTYSLFTLYTLLLIHLKVFRRHVCIGTKESGGICIRSNSYLIPEEKTTFLNYDICKIAGVDQVITARNPSA